MPLPSEAVGLQGKMIVFIKVVCWIGRQHRWKKTALFPHIRLLEVVTASCHCRVCTVCFPLVCSVDVCCLAGSWWEGVVKATGSTWLVTQSLKDPAVTSRTVHLITRLAPWFCSVGFGLVISFSFTHNNTPHPTHSFTYYLTLQWLTHLRSLLCVWVS